jgi:double-stranded uracil-DNA glycosylase
MGQRQIRTPASDRDLPDESDTSGRLHEEMIRSGFPGTLNGDPRVLILGSFPSRMSLERTEYYGNPKNHFWPIMEDLLSIDRSLPYADRIIQLGEYQIALWDVIRSCKRTGSGDSRIQDPILNDIPAFIARHPGLRLIAFNGAISRKFFDRFRVCCSVDMVTLPSTSPAHARLTIPEKTDRWRTICQYL